MASQIQLQVILGHKDPESITCSSSIKIKICFLFPLARSKSRTTMCIACSWTIHRCCCVFIKIIIKLIVFWLDISNCTAVLRLTEVGPALIASQTLLLCTCANRNEQCAPRWPHQSVAATFTYPVSRLGVRFNQRFWSQMQYMLKVRMSYLTGIHGPQEWLKKIHFIQEKEFPYTFI